VTRPSNLPARNLAATGDHDAEEFGCTPAEELERHFAFLSAFHFRSFVRLCVYATSGSLRCRNTIGRWLRRIYGRRLLDLGRDLSLTRLRRAHVCRLAAVVDGLPSRNARVRARRHLLRSLHEVGRSLWITEVNKRRSAARVRSILRRRRLRRLHLLRRLRLLRLLRALHLTLRWRPPTFGHWAKYVLSRALSLTWRESIGLTEGTTWAHGITRRESSWGLTHEPALQLALQMKLGVARSLQTRFVDLGRVQRRTHAIFEHRESLRIARERDAQILSVNLQLTEAFILLLKKTSVREVAILALTNETHENVRWGGVTSGHGRHTIGRHTIHHSCSLSMRSLERASHRVTSWTTGQSVLLFEVRFPERSSSKRADAASSELEPIAPGVDASISQSHAVTWRK